MENNVLEEVRIWKEKASRYDSLKERYDLLASKISNIIEELKDIQSDVAPYSMTSTKRITRRGSMKDIVEEFYKMMQAGTHVTSKLVETTHNNLSDKQVHYVMKLLQQCKGVDKAYDGRNVRLFAKREL